jgi:hypothetical protein
MNFPVNGSGEWTESGGMGEWPGPFGIHCGEIVTRAAADPRAPAAAAG